MAGALLIILGIALIACAYLISRKGKAFAAELEQFRQKAAEYDAVVLDIAEMTEKLPSGKEIVRKALIIQIRIEEQKRTLVHRCEEKFYNEYKRGDKVRVLFIEGKQTDKALISGDNRFDRFLRFSGRFRQIMAVVGIVTIVIGALLIV